MSDPKAGAPESWLRDLLQLKLTPRSGWFRIGVERPESVSDHSFAVGLMAWSAARAEGLDAGKALLMGLLHDFHEARLGDIPSPAKRYLSPAAVASAECTLRGEQWGSWAPEILELLEELEAGGSPEARLVRHLDREELRAQARCYLDAGYPLAEEFLRDTEDPA